MTSLAQDGSSCSRCVVGLPFNEATFSNESHSNETPCATWYLYGSIFSYSFEGKAAIVPQLLVRKILKNANPTTASLDIPEIHLETVVIHLYLEWC